MRSGCPSTRLKRAGSWRWRAETRRSQQALCKREALLLNGSPSQACAGQPLLRFRATWYCTTALDPGWEVRETGWHVSVDGDAPLEVTLRMPIPLERMAEVSPAYTANRAVNAVPYICAAAPGIHSTLDLPQVVTALG